MALEKKQTLRKVEIIFTDGNVNPNCHLQYDIMVEEDGDEVARSIHREVKNISEVMEILKRTKVHTPRIEI